MIFWFHRIHSKFVTFLRPSLHQIQYDPSYEAERKNDPSHRIFRGKKKQDQHTFSSVSEKALRMISNNHQLLKPDSPS